jgi:outer membrane protein insertion porin family
MAGPIDINKEAMGAKKMVVINTELIFPIARDIGLKGALFFDAGKGFDRLRNKTWRSTDNTDPTNPIFTVTRGTGLFPLRLAAGPGIRWFSPFGLIHIDLGFNLNPKKEEKGHVFDFTAGTVY